MKTDIPTLVLILVIINFLQILSFSLHYYADREGRGNRQWLFWSICSTAGYITMLLRLQNIGFIEFFLPLLTNIFLFNAYFFLVSGIYKFLDQTSNAYFLRGVAAYFFLGTVLSVFVLGDSNLRAIILYTAVGALIFDAAVTLWRKGGKNILVSARFLALLCLFQCVVLAFRSVVALTVSPIRNTFERSTIQSILFIVPIGMGYLWAFVIIVMVNQNKIAQYRESRTNQELIFNTHPDALLVTRVRDAKIVDINESFTKMTGFDRRRVIGKTTVELGIWFDPVDREHILEAVLNKGVCEDYEVSFRTKSGSVKSGIVSSRRVSLHGIPHIVSVLHDITGRKEMEIALRKSEEKFRLLVENSYDTIYTLAANGFFLFVSPVWTRQLGHAVIDVVGKSFEDYIHSDDVSAYREFFGKVRASGEGQSGAEYRVRHKNGEWFWHTSSAVPFFDEAGTVAGFYGIDRDITELRRVQKELELQATTDELTGAINRRHFIQLAAGEINRARRLNHALSLALIDIDHFKEVNDVWGHAVGDQALVFFSSTLRAHIREIDVLSRFGGDEFILLLPETSTSQACEVLERLATTLSENPFMAGDAVISLTVSAGLTSLAPGDQTDTIDSIFMRVDKALYKSKDDGRARFTVV